MDTVILGILDDNPKALTKIREICNAEVDTQILTSKDPEEIFSWVKKGVVNGLAFDYNLEASQNGVDCLKKIYEEFNADLPASIFSTSALLTYEESEYCKLNDIDIYDRGEGYKTVIQNASQKTRLYMNDKTKNILDDQSISLHLPYAINWHEAIVRKIKEELINSLKKIKNTYAGFLHPEGEQLSVPELISEIESESDFGKELVENWVEAKLRLHNLTNNAK